ncbi:hypothetical protein GCM10027511_24980 [Hymenobacter humi]
MPGRSWVLTRGRRLGLYFREVSATAPTGSGVSEASTWLARRHAPLRREPATGVAWAHHVSKEATVTTDAGSNF